MAGWLFSLFSSGSSFHSFAMFSAGMPVFLLACVGVSGLLSRGSLLVVASLFPTN